MTHFLDALSYIPGGLITTLQYTLLSILLGFLLGSILALLTTEKFHLFSPLAKTYISIFRGTPLIVQLGLIYYGLPSLLNIHISVFTAGVLSFSLNSAAYISEIIRAGIQSIDKGQFEAAIALGIPKKLMFKDIILPQAFKNTLPALLNEFINLLKESAIIYTIGGTDLMKRAYNIAAEQYSYFTPLLIAAACYYLTVSCFTFASSKLESYLKKNA